MKRFYKDVSVERSAAGYHVALDGRPVKTQRGGSQIVGSKALAEELAAEWASQGETCLLYTSPSPRDLYTSRMPSSA